MYEQMCKMQGVLFKLRSLVNTGKCAAEQLSSASSAYSKIYKATNNDLKGRRGSGNLFSSFLMSATYL